MKTIGMIGGMSWESSALYYRLINEETKRRLGGHHNAPSLMATVDFADVERLQHQGDWQRLATLLASTAQSLENLPELVLIEGIQQVAMKRDESLSPSLFTFRSQFAICHHPSQLVLPSYDGVASLVAVSGP